MSANDFKNAGNAAFAKGEYAESITQYTKAIELDSSNHVFFSNRSGAYAALGQFTSALSDAKNCVQLKPDFPKGFARVGAASVGLNDFVHAAEAYEQASTLDPNNASYKEEAVVCRRKADAAAAAGPPGFNPFGPNLFASLESNPATKAMVQGDANLRVALEEIAKDPNSLSKHANNPKVLTCLQALLGITPEMAHDQDESNKKRAEKEQEKDDFRSFAMPSMARDTTPQQTQEEEVAELDPELEAEKAERRRLREEADAEKAAGAELYKQRKFVEAQAHFTKAFEIDDSNPLYLLNVAACELEQNQLDECIATCNKALAVSGISGEQKSKAFCRIATANVKANNFDAAIAAYKRSILEDNSKVARLGLRKAEQAKKDYEKVQYLDDEKSEEAKVKGNEAYGNGNYAAAIDFYTDALKRNPKNYKVYSNRALCYTKVMQWDKALEDCDKCLEFDPKFVKALLRKGKVLHFLKSYHKAIECFREALEVEPNNADVLEALSTTQHAIYSTPRSQSNPQESEARMAEAMRDPEVQMAMQNPQMQALLQDMASNPDVAMKAMADPSTARIVEKLIAAGIIQVG